MLAQTRGEIGINGAIRMQQPDGTGDLYYVSIRPTYLRSLNLTSPCQKEKRNIDTYIPKHWHIHPAISVGHLEPVPKPTDDAAQDRRLAPMQLQDAKIDCIVRERQNGHETEYLAKFTNLPGANNRWLTSTKLGDDAAKLLHDCYKQKYPQPQTQSGYF